MERYPWAGSLEKVHFRKKEKAVNLSQDFKTLPCFNAVGTFIICKSECAPGRWKEWRQAVNQDWLLLFRSLEMLQSCIFSAIWGWNLCSRSGMELDVLQWALHLGEKGWAAKRLWLRNTNLQRSSSVCGGRAEKYEKRMGWPSYNHPPGAQCEGCWSFKRPETKFWRKFNGMKDINPSPNRKDHTLLLPKHATLHRLLRPWLNAPKVGTDLLALDLATTCNYCKWYAFCSFADVEIPGYKMIEVEWGQTWKKVEEAPRSKALAV